MRFTEDGRHMYGEILDCGVSSFFVNEVLGKVRGPSRNFHVVCAVALFALDVVRAEMAPGGTCERHKKAD